LLQQLLFDTAESITFCPTVRPGREVSQAVREVCEHPSCVGHLHRRHRESKPV